MIENITKRSILHDKKGKILVLLSFFLLVSMSPLAAQTVDPARALYLSCR